MAAHVTRCPHCRTTFRVKDEHLQVANGAVRCGSCLQVFKATEHFIDEEQRQDNGPAVTAGQNITKTASQPEQSKPETTEEDLLIHDDMDVHADIDDDVRISDDGLIHDDMEVDEESFSDDPLVDFNIRAPETQSRPAPRNDLEIDSSIFELKDASSETLDLLDPSAGTFDLKSDKNPDEAWADALLDDDGKTEEITLSGLDLTDNDQFNVDAAGNDDFSQFKAGAEADDFKGFNDDDDDSLHLGDDEFGDQIIEIQTPTQAVSDLQEDPLQLAAKKKQGSEISWGWVIASVLMLLVAASQTLYFKFDQWSRTPQWRPYYSLMCNLADCQLPDIQNLKQLSTQHLVVRSHPKLQQALVVDTLMQNHAEYEQPFPDMELVFSDLNDNIIASRRFIPAEYLSGELAGRQRIPSHTPIHIALEIADPGPEAVSYAIHLRANQ